MSVILLLMVLALATLVVWQKKRIDDLYKKVQEIQEKERSEFKSVQKQNAELAATINRLKTGLHKVLLKLAQDTVSLKESEKDIRNAIQEGEAATNKLRSQAEQIATVLFDKINDTTDSIQIINEEREDFKRQISEEQDEFKKKIKDENEELKKKIKDENEELKNRIKDENEEFKNRIGEENDDLRKKIDLLTEIREDSKHLNIKEDFEERERLIDQVLQEMEKGDIQEISEQVIGEAKNNKLSEEGRKVIKECLKNSVSATGALLDKEQILAYTLMSITNNNFFVTGKAGTGKSFLLDMFVKGNKAKKNIVMLASTGVAARHINGATLHSAFGYDNLEKVSLTDIQNNNFKLGKNKKEVLCSADTIVIDEVSMVRVDVFEKIDYLLRSITHNDAAFGGKQIILFGDLFQLPPIVKEEKKSLINTYGGVFFFNSNAYKNGDFQFIELTINHRQRDDKVFFDILNRIREGSVCDQDLEVLNSRTKFEKDQIRRVIKIFPKKEDVKYENRKELNKIDTEAFEYEAQEIYKKPGTHKNTGDNGFQVDNKLILKVGAQVMMVTNDSQKRWVNGTIGIVSDLAESFIKVTIDNVEYDIPKHKFQEQEAVYRNGKITYETVYAIEQYPLVLAYAITIHKSQGMTYPRIVCDLRECFAPGQAYVALSRCTSLEGLFLSGKVDIDNIFVDETVKEFYLKQIDVCDVLGIDIQALNDGNPEVVIEENESEEAEQEISAIDLSVLMDNKPNSSSEEHIDESTEDDDYSEEYFSDIENFSHYFPDRARSFSFHLKKNMKKCKPYGMVIEGEVIEESVSWMDLLFKVIDHVIDFYGITVDEILDGAMGTDLGGEHILYFLEGFGHGNEYRYYPEYDLSVYVKNANAMVDVMDELLCGYIGILADCIHLFYR